MYHCHVCFYFIGNQNQLFEIVRGMPPFSPFVHEFIESVQPQEEFAAKADVLLVDLQGLDAAKAVQTLIGWKKPEADLILLAEQGQFAVFADALEAVTDVWMMPMTDAELRFRFRRWQQNCKTQRDFWQASQYLESTINSVPNLIWYKDKNGIHEKVNDSFCKTVNKTKEQVQGRGHAYIWDVEQDDPACIESERIVMEKEETLVSEEIIQTGEGTRVLTTYKSPLYDWDGSVMGTVGVAIDVTKERAYAQELIKKNQTLEMLFTTMDCGVMCHTLDGSRIISINRAALNILGYQSRAELSRAGFNLVASSVHEEDRSKVEYSIQSLKNVGDSVNLEYRVRHSDGAIVYVLGSFKLVEEDGEVCCQRFLLDRTAEKFQEEEERMRDKRKQMELIQALSIDYNLICFFDLENGTGKALRIGECKNKILDSVFAGELSWEECMERYIETGIFDEDKETMRCAVSRKQLELELSKKPIFTVNYRITCCGEMRYFQMKVVRVGDWSKNRNVVLGLRSVDEETRSERERNDLLENALLQANRASKAKSIFLSNMSHDIRTPMNAIIGFATIAVSHIDNKEQVRDCLQKVLSSSNHLLSLINDILDMSRIESGKVQIKEQECNISELMHNLVNIIQPQVKAKQLELFIDTFEVVNEEVIADALKLNQVFINLLSNAVKYTPAGGTITFRIMQKTAFRHGYGDYIFIIKDNGIGMSSEFVQHIFEPFEREASATQSGIQGTGLGMAITKNIVEMMNGTISVESEAGKGSTFTVELSLKFQDTEKNSEEIKELNGLRALVVDDDYHVCDSVDKMLKKIGMRSEWTTSGREAVYRAKIAHDEGDSYHTYIIDWQMPEVSGVETARRIRNTVGNDVPIIILTAYDWTDIEEEAKEAGVTAFCAKPLFMSDLKSALLAANNLVEKDEEAAEWTLADFSGKRVLLVEDIELNREIAEVILTEAGFVVETAPDGTDAVEMVERSEENYYDVILMDVQMPIMNGYEATRTIRNMQRNDVKTLPIIAMTANALEEDKEAALKNGMNAHIAKPLDMDIFMQVLKQYLD